MLIGEVFGARGEEVLELHLERTAVADDVRLAVLVDDLFLELPLLAAVDADERAEVVEVEHRARLVLAEELDGRSGEVGLRLGLLRRQFAPHGGQHALADVANDVVALLHQDGALPSWEDASPEGRC